MKAVTVCEERKPRTSLLLKYRLMAKLCLVVKGRNPCRNLPQEVIVSHSLGWLQEQHWDLAVSGCGKGKEGRGHFLAWPEDKYCTEWNKSCSLGGGSAMEQTCWIKWMAGKGWADGRGLVTTEPSVQPPAVDVLWVNISTWITLIPLCLRHGSLQGWALPGHSSEQGRCWQPAAK